MARVLYQTFHIQLAKYQMWDTVCMSVNVPCSYEACHNANKSIMQRLSSQAWLVLKPYRNIFSKIWIIWTHLVYNFALETDRIKIITVTVVKIYPPPCVAFDNLISIYAFFYLSLFAWLPSILIYSDTNSYLVNQRISIRTWYRFFWR